MAKNVAYFKVWVQYQSITPIFNYGQIEELDESQAKAFWGLG
jgi:hypothetical protein